MKMAASNSRKKSKGDKKGHTGDSIKSKAAQANALANCDGTLDHQQGMMLARTDMICRKTVDTVKASNCYVAQSPNSMHPIVRKKERG
jgi:hypothetical protein